MASYDDTATVSGSVVGFTNGADSVPLKNWLVTLPTSLDGYTSIVGSQAGKNLIKIASDNYADGQKSTAEYTNSGVSVTATGTYGRSGYSFAVKTGQTYTLSFTGYSTGDYNRLYLNNKVSWSGQFKNLLLTSEEAQYSVTFTSTTDLLFIGLYVSGGGTTGTMTISNVQLEVNSSASSYEPYKAPTSYTANLGRTVYGTDADIVTGEGSEIVKKITVSAFTGTWGAVNNGYGYYISDADTTHNLSVVNPVMMKANQLFTYGGLGRNTAPTWQYGGNDGAQTVHTFILPSEYDTLTKANNFLASLETPLEVTLTLATPTDFTFDGQEIPSLLSSNTFWSDQGNTELTYYKDGYGFTSVTVHKETPDGEPVEETRKLHRIIYEGQVDVINGTGLIYRGESGTQYDPPEQISFTPIEVSTDEGENTLYAYEGDSAITYRKAVD